MKIKTILFLSALFIRAVSMQAQAPTWAADVAPILYNHCVSCHRVDGVGSFPLETWSDAKNNADGLLSSVESRNMPPWRADPAYRHFKDENYLTTAEIQTIADWVNGGKLPGDVSQAPPLPNFVNGSQLDGVDISLETPMYTIPQWEDEYRAFVFPTGVSVDKFFNQIEFLPGNDAVIHHIVLYSDPTNEPLQKDLADPAPGFKTNGMVGNITQNATLIGEWTPGGTPIKLPPAFGYRIPKNGYFMVEVHYAPGHFNQVDEGSIVNLKLTPSPLPRELYYGVLAYGDSTGGLVNPPFIIPANTEHKLIAQLPVVSLTGGAALSLFSLTPHAHVVGKSFKAYAYRNGFTDTIPLINIPKWDFYWQATYTLRKPVKLAGNRITRAEVVYDNTENNPLNPHSPPQDVWWGEKTSDEMLYLFATVAVYQSGDENIILDSTLLTDVRPVISDDGRFTLAPNPVTDAIDVRAETPVDGVTDFILSDMNGRVLRQWREQNFQRSRTSAGDLTPGLYVLQLRNGNSVSTIKLMKE